VLRIDLTSWSEARERASGIRFAVFVEEQGVPAELELDEHDPNCIHALAIDERNAVAGTGRLLPATLEDGRRTGHVGRMAVVKEARGKGVGGAILERLIEAARARGDEAVALSAQTHALAFYRRHGFEPYGNVYLEAGIEHRAMRRVL
jgi:predicted GNAT family N-acyltransferase